MKHILVIGGWNEILKDALEMGFLVSFFGDCKSDLLKTEVLQKCHFIENIDIKNIGLCLFFAEYYNKKRAFDFVVSFTEFGLDTAAIIGKILNIKGIELHPTLLTRNKELMRMVLETTNLSIPWKLCHNIDDVNSFYKKLGDTIILKPTNGVGSEGIKMFNDQNNITEDIKYPLIAEKYIRSDIVYSAETVSCNGSHSLIATSAQHLFNKSLSIFSHIIVPAQIDYEKLKEIKILIFNFLDKIELKNGVAHTEFMIDNKTFIPYIIESQTRVGGSRIWEMINLTTGISQFKYYYNTLLNNIITTDFLLPTKTIAALLFILPKSGIVKEVIIKKDINSIEGVVEYSLKLQKGDSIDNFLTYTSNKGIVIIASQTIDTVYELLNNICSSIQILYEDNTVWSSTYERV